MKLFAWQPHGHGLLSFFVMAIDEEAAINAIDAEVYRRSQLASYHPDKITDSQVGCWGTDHYILTVVEQGVVIVNEND